MFSPSPHSTPPTFSHPYPTFTTQRGWGLLWGANKVCRIAWGRTKAHTLYLGSASYPTVENGFHKASSCTRDDKKIFKGNREKLPMKKLMIWIVKTQSLTFSNKFLRYLSNALYTMYYLRVMFTVRNLKIFKLLALYSNIKSCKYIESTLWGTVFIWMKFHRVLSGN